MLQIIFLFLLAPTLLLAKPLHIIVDAGHGGHDTGALSFFKNNRVKESDLTLSLATKIKLIAEKKYKQNILVTLTRDHNKYIPLQQRFLNNTDADLLVSIHYNSSYSKQINGTEIYFPESRPFSQQETKKEQSDLTAIVSDLQNTGRIQKSILNAEKISTLWPLGLVKIRSGQFYLLEKSKIPTLLLEVGYISNKNSLESLLEVEKQNEIADHLLKSLSLNSINE
jgi:N-acetylmuramoyl-L-alanine amidase